jgi:hypothetical protein
MAGGVIPPEGAPEAPHAAQKAPLTSAPHDEQKGISDPPPPLTVRYRAIARNHAVHPREFHFLSCAVPPPSRLIN